MTDCGSVDIEIYVHAVENMISVKTFGFNGEKGAGWRFVPEEAFSPRQAFGLKTGVASRYEVDYQSNPPGKLEVHGELQLWKQPLLAGGGAVTSWIGDSLDFRLTVAFSKRKVPTDAVTTYIKSLSGLAYNDLLFSHTSWWHLYYPPSHISVPDLDLESLYWRQIYKIACSTRRDRSMIDNNGPWLQPTPWPYATWNLNVQLSYWCMLASNHADLAESLMSAIHDHRQELIDNCEEEYRDDSATLLRAAGNDLYSPAQGPARDGPVGRQGGLVQGATANASPEMGNLTWALHNCWLLFKHTMDLAILKDKLFPMLRRTTNYYLHFLYKGDDGRFHLPPTYSPEYASAHDCVYNLALLRWSCGALLEGVKYLGISDPLEATWRDILVNLVDYPQDADGWLIGAEVKLEDSHRHYSHLLQAYPLYLVNRDQARPAVDLIQKTLDHWQSMPAKLEGYSYTGASSISSALGRGDQALSHLKGLFHRITPNTMYKEDGPVIETPLSAAQSILDMLLQSWGGVVRPFPAVPSAWDRASFTTLSAEGAFTVSARWVDHRTEWIHVHSRAGQSLVLETDIQTPTICIGSRKLPVVRDERGFLVIELAQGESVDIAAG